MADVTGYYLRQEERRNMKNTILIVDDEDDIRLLIQGLLEDEGYKVLSASGCVQAYELIQTENPDLVIQDIWLQGSADDGMDILQQVKTTHKHLPFIMISGHGTIETAVSSIKFGAYDFIEKPFKSDRLLLMVERALENLNLKKQNESLKQQASLSISKAAEQLPDNIKQALSKAAATNSRLLITGEVGSGKSTAAHYIHEQSERKHKPFMTLNCANPNTDALMLELFGEAAHPGLVELTDGGTLLLSDVTMLPLEIQGKVLMLLQENAYYAAGSSTKRPVDVRVIATSATNPENKIEQGGFREDLYYRLNVVPIIMPSLRERKAEIESLITLYCDHQFSLAAMTRLKNHPWPGNIKQLHNVLEWISIMHDKDQLIDTEHLPSELGGKKSLNAQPSQEEVLSLDTMIEMGLREARECFERHYLLSQIQRFDGNISKTAEFIGMERSALHRKLKSLDVLSENKQNVA